ncbi:ABC transporter substrate-binding protein [Paludibaculum fermentans]|uniref:ABC transporter substrate-binding protein n=1 Tax=Paludibaculum fermentans TaxID=1473598 RepID=UPI003EBC42EA
MRASGIGRRLAALILVTAAACAAAQPQRIVSTAPSITEVLYALGLGDRVAGVTQYCRYPVDAQKKPKIGSFLQPDFERILALKPDLVLVIKNPIQVAERLRKLGVQAAEVNQDSIDDVFRSIESIGKLTGTETAARQLTTDLRSQLDQVRAKARTQPRIKALFLVGRSPGSLQGMVGVGPRTFIDELVTLAGGDNLLSNSPIQYPKVSVEQVLSGDPQVILDMGDFAHIEGKPLEAQQQFFTLWARYPNLTAVKTRRVVQIDSDVFIHPGPRMGIAARAIYDHLHGAAAR